MDPKDVQEALKNLQRFLLDEYGWDTQDATDPPAESELPEGQNRQLDSPNTAYHLDSVSG